MLPLTSQIPDLNATIPYYNVSCSIDDFRNKVYSTAYSMFTVFGLIGNIFALVVLIKTYSQRTAFHIYMLNLAISDLLFVCTLPLRVVYYVSKGHWYFGDFLCRITSYVFYVNLYCSIFILTAMSVTRFLAIVYPVKNLKLVSERRAKWACVVIWLFVTLTSSPFLMSGSYLDSQTQMPKCFEPPPSAGKKKMVLTLNYISFVIGFLIPFIVILVCYTMIIKTLLKNPMTKQQSSRKKAIRMIIIVMTVFFLSFMPYHIQRAIHLHQNKNCSKETLWEQKKVVITLALAASNCCFDPMLYFFSGENFRRRLSTFRKHSVTSMAVDNKRKKSDGLHDRSEIFANSEKQDSDES
ncbi:cysteinyl leukotriene receptor 1 [Hyla sarda]|uniref:cysteinyl leukotriene receptor 1 n=1 Tax=Hyla sarda TaxID=327740 RepID=UPI0024C372A8|nr:cysteinyl leukotriene receptor 1 [Hyla sarda]XP_056394874.1 cysteinyl leukotriene receptor 1 [Hyla sarda]XP_056394875.1 cysteinyl leukotriene receptor 1 [Hyla sarda]XP_056394876.1 cysteinyl leukotriene receptor 1 [Hyla sarda]XP_056394877.1 cysteinyl leukotriene receptor 1 [Hyla sarda]XP_056394878.1 cysteinyl leukotriene receptor 1 [Hyla sarda]